MQRYYDVDPIVNELYVDNNGNKYSVLVTNEEHRVVDSRVILNGLPDPGYRVVVESNGNILTEVSLNEKLSDNTKYKVDYANGFVNLHSSLEGQTVNVKQYHSRGLTYFPASRIYTELDEWGKVKETVADIEGSIAQVIEITETLPDKLEQVIEARQTIDNEMPKIEEFGRQFNELKQMSEEATVQANIIMDFMSQVDGVTDKLQEQILKSQEQYELLQSSMVDTDALIGRLETLDGQIQDLINNSNTTRTELANSILTFNNEVGDIVDRLNMLEGNLSGYETNINALIEKADKARQMLQDTIDGSDLGGYATKIELNTKADLGADGKVLPNQIPKIGGRNLLVGTANVLEYDLLATDYYKEYITNVKLEPDTEYTLSFVAERLSQDSVPIVLALGGSDDINSSFRYDYLPRFVQDVKFSQKNSYTFKFTKDGMTSDTRGYNPYLVLRFRNNLKATKIRISQLKLEKGTVATDWTPAPEDFALADHVHLDKADLGADGKVLPDQLPTTEVHFRDTRIAKGFVKFKLNVPVSVMFGLDINVMDMYNHYRIRVTGYNYAETKNWLRQKVSLLESSLDNVNVYIGYDGDNDLWIALDRIGYFGATINNLLLNGDPISYDTSKIEMIQEQELTGTTQETFNLKKLANVGQLPTQEQITSWNSKQDKLVAGTNITISDNTISATDTIYTHPTNHPATMITEDGTHRFVTDAEKATWNNMLPKSSVVDNLTTVNSTSPLSANQGVELKKLIDSKGSTYIHPTSHPASMITQDTNNRFVSDAEKTTWNAKQDKLMAGNNVIIGADGKTISAKDTTYNVATTSANGLMSSVDKMKLDGLSTQKVITAVADLQLSVTFGMSVDFIKIGNVAQVRGGFGTARGTIDDDSIFFVFPAGFEPKHIGSFFVGYLFDSGKSATPIPIDVYRGVARCAAGFSVETLNRMLVFDYTYLCE